jgi:Xaa-Pro aminopeptidase
VLKKRLERVQTALQAKGLDAVALLPGANLRYLTGVSFHSTERSLIGLFPAEGEPVMVIPGLECTKIRDVTPYPIRFFTWSDEQGPDSAFAEAAQAVGLVQAAQVIGVESLTMRFQELRSIEKHAPQISLVAGDAALFAARRCKDRAEIDLLRKAIAISETALSKALKKVEPGMSEQTIANLIQIEILAAGGEPSFALVQGGVTSAQPHAEGGDRRVAAGEPLLIDWGAKVGGYSADITRTFVMAGEPDPRLLEIYELVKAANLAGRQACAPGIPAEEVDRATRQVIEKGGYGEQFFHRTGHGLGLDIHEEPYIVAGNTTPLAAGNVFTVEPGIYVDGLGGVRIEDDVLVTTDGAETLTSFKRELQVIGG